MIWVLIVIAVVAMVAIAALDTAHRRVSRRKIIERLLEEDMDADDITRVIRAWDSKEDI